jgi:2-dehydropantoate 2-reductase
MIWSKVAFNSVLNTLCTLMFCPVSALAAYPEFWKIAGDIIDEIAAVGAAENVAIDGVVVRRTIEGATDPSMSGHHLPSDAARPHQQPGHRNRAPQRRNRPARDAKHHIPTPANESDLASDPHGRGNP